MASFRERAYKIGSNAIVRNLVLAVSGILVFVFVTSILLNIFTRHNRSLEVPDFSEMTMDQALQLADHGSFRLEINDSLFVPAYDGGVILDQLPKPGVHVKSGRRIFLTVNSYRQEMVRIPYVTGYSLRQAKNNLEVAGLEIDKLIFQPDIATENVLEQRYKGTVITRTSNIEAEKGSGITLVVGKRVEDPSPVVPKLVGFPMQEAKSRIWEAGLNVAELIFDEDITLLNRNEAKVYSQKPEQGSTAAYGTPVTIRLTLDTEKVAKGSEQSDAAAKRLISGRRAAQTQQTQQQ